jgi:hypothetical protein
MKQQLTMKQQLAAVTKKKKNKHTPPSRPFDPHKKPKVTRANIVMPADSEKTVAELQAEIDQAGTTEAPTEPQRRLVARSSIHVAGQVFQWRGAVKRDQWNRENHVRTLARAISDSEKPLDRLLVFLVGSSYYVIDGHHRLAAYDTAGWIKDIPVVVFAGTLSQARLRALDCNVKDKLAMTTQAKSEAAWRITKENLGELEAEQVADRTSVSRRQAFYMKSTWKELNERNDKATIEERVDRESLLKLTWPQARAMRNGETLDDDFDPDNWKHQKAQAVIDLMQRHNVTAGLLQDIEITALVLERLSESLPADLVSWWARDHWDLIEEIAKDIDEDQPPEDRPF